MVVAQPAKFVQYIRAFPPAKTSLLSNESLTMYFCGTDTGNLGVVQNSFCWMTYQYYYPCSFSCLPGILGYSGSPGDIIVDSIANNYAISFCQGLCGTDIIQSLAKGIQYQVAKGNSKFGSIFGINPSAGQPTLNQHILDQSNYIATQLVQ